MTSNQPWWLTWPVAEVAAAILPYFSSRAPETQARATHQIVSWCRTGAYSGSLVTPGDLEIFKNPDYRAIAEAIQALEHAGLLIQTVAGTSGSIYLGLTRLGMHVLQTNTVRQRLGLGEAAPSS